MDILTRILLCFAIALIALPAEADDDLIAGLSAPRIAVTTGFVGAELMVFGNTDDGIDLAITVEGPQAEAVLREKMRFGGLWVRGNSFHFRRIPGFFAVGGSSPSALAQNQPALNSVIDIRQFISADDGRNKERAEHFYRALIDTEAQRGLYHLDPVDITILSRRLFKATFELPAAAPLGTYYIHVGWSRNGKRLAQQTMPLVVGEEGLSATIFKTAHTYPLLYALATLAMSVLLGAGSAILLRKVYT